MNERQIIKTLNAKYVEQTSNKTGKKYKCIVVELCKGKEKLLMLNDNEKFIIENMNNTPFNK